MELRSSARTGTSSLTSIWLEKDNFTELENFYETFKEKENVSQRRKDQMKMLLNQYEKIRRIYTEKDYIGSRTEALVSHECSNSLSSRPKAFSRKKIKRRAMYHQTTARIGTRLTNCILMGQERIQWKK